MTDKSRRKELLAQYRQSRPEAGVYRIVNLRTNRALLGSSPNLSSVRGKLEFARSVNASGAQDPRAKDDLRQLGPWLKGQGGTMASARRLGEDIQEFGIDSFSMEVLEVLEITPETTDQQVLNDLAALEDLWRERLDPSQLY